MPFSFGSGKCLVRASNMYSFQIASTTFASHTRQSRTSWKASLGSGVPSSVIDIHPHYQVSAHKRWVQLARSSCVLKMTNATGLM